MKTIIIIGGTREAAYEELKRTADGDGDGIVRHEFHDEVTLGGYPFMAIGGTPDDVCFLRGVGFDVKIITVEQEIISEAMWRRIQHVRSTCADGFKQDDLVGHTDFPDFRAKFVRYEDGVAKVLVIGGWRGSRVPTGPVSVPRDKLISVR